MGPLLIQKHTWNRSTAWSNFLSTNLLLMIRNTNLQSWKSVGMLNIGWKDFKMIEQRRGRSLSSLRKKLKKKLRKRFVPKNFRQLYIRWSSLKQEKKSVIEYHKELEKLNIMWQIEEREELKIGRFVGGLNEESRERFYIHSNYNFDEVVRLTVTYEGTRWVLVRAGRRQED